MAEPEQTDDRTEQKYVRVVVKDICSELKPNTYMHVKGVFEVWNDKGHPVLLERLRLALPVGYRFEGADELGRPLRREMVFDMGPCRLDACGCVKQTLEVDVLLEPSGPVGPVSLTICAEFRYDGDSFKTEPVAFDKEPPMPE